MLASKKKNVFYYSYQVSIERPEINQTEEIQLKIPICIKNLGFQISVLIFI